MNSLSVRGLGLPSAAGRRSPEESALRGGGALAGVTCSDLTGSVRASLGWFGGASPAGLSGRVDGLGATGVSVGPAGGVPSGAWMTGRSGAAGAAGGVAAGGEAGGVEGGAGGVLIGLSSLPGVDPSAGLPSLAGPAEAGEALGTTVGTGTVAGTASEVGVSDVSGAPPVGGPTRAAGGGATAASAAGDGGGGAAPAFCGGLPVGVAGLSPPLGGAGDPESGAGGTDGGVRTTGAPPLGLAGVALVAGVAPALAVPEGSVAPVGVIGADPAAGGAGAASEPGVPPPRGGDSPHRNHQGRCSSRAGALRSPGRLGPLLRESRGPLFVEGRGGFPVGLADADPGGGTRPGVCTGRNAVAPAPASGPGPGGATGGAGPGSACAWLGSRHLIVTTVPSRQRNEAVTASPALFSRVIRLASSPWPFRAAGIALAVPSRRASPPVPVVRTATGL
jgi:hypothetical protein